MRPRGRFRLRAVSGLFHGPLHIRVNNAVLHQLSAIDTEAVADDFGDAVFDNIVRSTAGECGL
jgi:hypothetical protein